MKYKNNEDKLNRHLEHIKFQLLKQPAYPDMTKEDLEKRIKLNKKCDEILEELNKHCLEL